MPRGTDPSSVQWAAREFANSELADHKYVMVLHDHQANPHVHISVRAESVRGRRLNPRKTDLHRWRETFATKLRERGIEAEATRQATRGAARRYPELWQLKAREDGRLRASRTSSKAVMQSRSTADAINAWVQLGRALESSANSGDRSLARSIARFVRDISAERLNTDPIRATRDVTAQLREAPVPRR